MPPSRKTIETSLYDMKVNPRPGETIRGSFTVWDLIAILVVTGVFGGWFVFAHSGERGHIARCAGNLKALGEATQAYANDHNDGLPAAVIDTRAMGAEGQVTCWDMALAPYLEPRLAKAKSIYEQNQLWPAVQPYLVCPSDPFKRAEPRCYAMATRIMQAGWPPSPQDMTGVGVVWNKQFVSALLGQEMAGDALKNPDLLPRLKRSLLPDPANTLLLTELIAPGNHLRRGPYADVNDANVQEESFNGDSSSFHFGKFHYLMADGHVKLLTGPQTDGSDGQSRNIWTINAED
jgi:prepilin-type processing-associated H-X9-DG protein